MISLLAPAQRALCALFAVALVLAAGVPAPAAPLPAPLPEPRLEDLMVPPGSSGPVQPFMRRADYYDGIDRRLTLDSLAYALENGSRCIRIVGRDSLWAVDYCWIYPHTGLPSHWYDLREFIQTADSLDLPPDTELTATVGTLRIGVRAGSLDQARAEARRLRPREMPAQLLGRLKLKLERARQVLPDGGGARSSDATGH